MGGGSDTKNISEFQILNFAILTMLVKNSSPQVFQTPHCAHNRFLNPLEFDEVIKKMCVNKKNVLKGGRGSI